MPGQMVPGRGSADGNSSGACACRKASRTPPHLFIILAGDSLHLAGHGHHHLQPSSTLFMCKLCTHFDEDDRLQAWRQDPSGRICQWLLTCWSPGCINPRPCNCAIPSSCQGLAPSCAGPVDLALSSQQLQERACGGLPHVCACVNARRSPGTALLAASSSASMQPVDFGMSCVCVCAHGVHGQAMLRQTKSRQPHLVGSIAIIFYCCVNFEGRFEVKGAPAVTLTNLRVAEWLTSLQGHGAAMSSPQQQSNVCSCGV